MCFERVYMHAVVNLCICTSGKICTSMSSHVSAHCVDEQTCCRGIDIDVVVAVCSLFCVFNVMLDFDLISNSLSSSRFAVFSCALENVTLALAFTVIHYTNMLPSMMFCILGDVMDGTKTGHERLRYRLPTMIFECSNVVSFVSRLW